MAGETAYTCIHVFNGGRPVKYMCRDQGDLILTCGADDHEQLADDWKVVHSAHFLGHASGVIAKDLADGYEAERETSDSSWLRSAVTE